MRRKIVVWTLLIVILPVSVVFAACWNVGCENYWGIFVDECICTGGGLADGVGFRGCRVRTRVHEVVIEHGMPPIQTVQCWCEFGEICVGAY